PVGKVLDPGGAGAAGGGGDQLAGDPGDGVLPGAVDVGDDHPVGERQGGSELPVEVPGARGQVGLEHGPQPRRPVLGGLAGGGGHLGRVVGVVVDHPHAGRERVV